MARGRRPSTTRFASGPPPHGFAAGRIKRQHSTPKQTRPLNKPFLHYPAMSAFIRLFRYVDKRGRCPACGCGHGGRVRHAGRSKAGAHRAELS